MLSLSLKVRGREQSLIRVLSSIIDKIYSELVELIGQLITISIKEVGFSNPFTIDRVAVNYKRSEYLGTLAVAYNTSYYASSISYLKGV